MLGLATRGRTATAVAGAVGLAVLLLGTTVWPATGHRAEPATRGSASDTDTVEFDGGLHANAETGCIELPPDDWSSADVVPVEPSPGVDDTSLEDVDKLLDERAIPLRRGDVDVRAEPWPACDEPPRTVPVGAGEGADG